MSKVVLNVAHRNMLRGVFITMSGVEDVKTEDVLEIAAITDALDLDDAEETVTKIDRDVQRAYMKAQREVRSLSLEIEKLDQTKAPISKKLYASYDQAQEEMDLLPATASYSLLMEAEMVEYDLEKSAIDWLVEKFKDFKWNQRLSRDQQGEITISKKTLQPEEAVVAASLIRAVKASAL